MNRLRVLRGGLLTTVQDQGRPEFRRWGVPLGGAMDRMSHELANRLAGNTAQAATLEMTLNGAELEFSGSTVIAVTGAEMQPELRVPTRIEELSDETELLTWRVPTHRPVIVPAGSVVRFGTARRGCRCYMAVFGGIQVPLVMGSRSTFLRAGLGGYEGRSLRQGDLVEYKPLGLSGCGMFTPALPDQKPVGHVQAPRWFVRPVDLPDTRIATLRIVPGESFRHLPADSVKQLQDGQFLISPQSDRMGYRLSGCPMRTLPLPEMFSEGTTVGTLQLPPGGDPILLMADSAPTGGYPRIAHVISADLPAAAQLRPGQQVRFELTTLETAHELLRHQRRVLDRALCMAGLMDVSCFKVNPSA